MSAMLQRSGGADADVTIRQWIAHAMRAMRDGRTEAAWLWADRLCRQTRGAARINALLLRSAILARQGDHDAAQADLRAAAGIDPADASVNRLLVNSPISDERIAAARSLAGSAAASDRRIAFAAFAREGFDCVALLEASGRRIGLTLAWNGAREIALSLRSDLGERSMTIRADEAPPAPTGFQHAAKLAFDPPPGAEALTLGSETLRLLCEPAVLLLDAGRPTKPAAAKAPSGELLIVVPVYGDRTATLECFASLLANPPAARSVRIVAIEDASPDSELRAELAALAADRRIELLTNPLNLGFARSVNRGLALRAPGQDALVLNADVVMPPGAIEGLARHVAAHPDIGSVTPLSNNGEDTSCPVRFRANTLPAPPAIAALNAIAGRVNCGRSVDMPNGVGFCLYVRGAALDKVGFMPRGYGRGYYEDVAFCLDLAQAGYRNVCAADVYVGHHGGRSFGGERRPLVARNRLRLASRHPEYFAKAAAFERSDPLQEPIGRIEFEQLRRRRAVDLLLAPADAPHFVIGALAGALGALHAGIVIAQITRSASTLEIALRSTAGETPQNIVWRFDVSGDLTDEISACFSPLSLQSLFAVDDDVCGDVARALSRGGAAVRWLSPGSLTFEDAATHEGADTSTLPSPRTAPARASDGRNRRAGRHAQVLRLPSPADPALRPPALANGRGALAIIGPLAPPDIGLLARLAAAMRGGAENPAVLFAGRLTGVARAAAPDEIHVAGAIDDADLPRWLERAGASAVFFASRMWGAFDPRVRLWADAGVPVAAFGPSPATAGQEHRLDLPKTASGAAAAQSVTIWLAKLRETRLPPAAAPAIREIASLSRPAAPAAPRAASHSAR